MDKYKSPYLKGLKPYTPGEQPKDKKYIKLNTNENPYGPAPGVIETIKNSANESLRLYPLPECEPLRQKIADYNNLNIENIYVGNGSDELLAFCFMAFFRGRKPILINDITYTFYKVYAAVYGVETKIIPLDEDFNIPYKSYNCENGGIIICNPNAPTGKETENDKIEWILKNNLDSVVVVDEAYVDFGGKTCTSLIKKYPNLIVVKTMSKARSLAGLRLGYIMGQKHLINTVAIVKNSINSYTVDTISIKAGIAALEDNDYFEKTRNSIIKIRELTVESLRRIGFCVHESKANFLFASHEKVSAGDIFTKLKERGILVRYFKQKRIDNYLRISIGEGEEMHKLITALKKILNE